MNKIVFINEDGNCAIVNPAPNARRKDESETDFLSRLAERVVQAGKPYKIVSEVPSDRTFRNAWEMVSEKIETNMDKAREIARENVRRVRAPKLAELDSAYLRADEREDQAEKQAIITKKQALRDATKDTRLTRSATEAELKSAMETIEAEIESTQP